MKKPDIIGSLCAIMVGLLSHLLCFLHPVFRLPTQDRIIMMLELTPLVIACLHNKQNDVSVAACTAIASTSFNYQNKSKAEKDIKALLKDIMSFKSGSNISTLIKFAYDLDDKIKDELLISPEVNVYWNRVTLRLVDEIDQSNYMCELKRKSETIVRTMYSESEPSSQSLQKEPAKQQLLQQQVPNNQSKPLERQESFESDYYHPGRKYLHVYEGETPWPDIEEGKEWYIEDTSICNELKRFKKASSQINMNQGNMGDMRILALHLIFPFMLSVNESITKYMGSTTRKLVEKKIEHLYEPAPATTANLLLWCKKLRTTKLDLFRMKNECRKIMNQVNEMGDDKEALTSYILFDLVLQLTKFVDSGEKGEDTFVKSYLKCFLANFFSVEASIYQSWANVVLNNKNDDQVKPGWIAYVKPWFKKFDMIACEVKPLSKVGRGDVSDYVKLGIEMKDMLNEIIGVGVNTASVLGILVEGK